LDAGDNLLDLSVIDGWRAEHKEAILRTNRRLSH
jgi:hypothetical protein